MKIDYAIKLIDLGGIANKIQTTDVDNTDVERYYCE